MSSAENKRQVILDTETTGFEPKTGDRVIEIGCIELINRRPTENRFHVYLNPEGKKVGSSFDVHGISDDFLLDKPKFAEISDEFLAWIGNDEIIAHNAPFDLKFLNHELSLLANPVLLESQNQITDSLEIAKEKHPGQRNNLDVLCNRYKIDSSGRDLHGALIDADLLAQVYLALTGGQYSLLGGKNDGDDNAESQYVNAISREDSDKWAQQLVSVELSAEQLQQHESYLDQLKVDANSRW